MKFRHDLQQTVINRVLNFIFVNMLWVEISKVFHHWYDTYVVSSSINDPQFSLFIEFSHSRLLSILFSSSVNYLPFTVLNLIGCLFVQINHYFKLGTNENYNINLHPYMQVGQNQSSLDMYVNSVPTHTGWYICSQ